MKIVIAVDSFKGSLTSIEAGNAIAEGIRRVDAQAEICVRPLADGGEGTVEALVQGMHGSMRSVTVTGPLGTPVECLYGILADGITAVIEMAGAAGITLVPEEMRNPMHTTTFGVGEVIKDAIVNGCRRFIVGIGGSATNDGGAGMLQALGFGLLDQQGKQIPFGAKGLEQLKTVTDAYVLPQLSECEFRVACDVTNVLCGKNGCSAVFGPQKGADLSMIRQMDKWLENYATLVRLSDPGADPNKPGTGAAGGLGFAFLSFTNAVLEPGIRIVLEETALDRYMENADFVITGEGRMDGQTALGKAPVGVAEAAKKRQIPVIAFAGSVGKEAAVCNQSGITAFFPVLRDIMTLEDAMKPENAKANLADAAEQVFRLIKACKM